MVNSDSLSRIKKRSKSETQWALLGDIEIEITTAPQAFDYTEGSKLVEIEKVGEKPGLQFTGENLNTISWTFRLHAGWCDPEVQLKELQDAHREHKPMTLTLGSGLIKGNYVIEELSVPIQRTDFKGKLVLIEVTVKLKETASKVKRRKNLKSPFKTRK